MSKPTVFVTRPIPREGIDLLREDFEVVVAEQDAPLPRRELLDAVAGADAIIGLLTDRIDAELFDAAPKLKGYANYAVGFDNIDLAEATRRGVPVSNTPDVLTTATAELAWALVFAVARRVVEADEVARSGEWPGWGPLQFLGMGLTGRTLGVVGAGRIGTAMGLMSSGFGMRVLYTTSGSVNETLEQEVNARRVGLDELLAEADVVSIHTPLTGATRHLFDAQAFAAMKPTAILVNTGRGPVVDEEALVEALETKRIAGAGLDVYENEPAIHPGLPKLSNVVLLPHIGSATTRARRDMSLLAAENVRAMLTGATPPTCLNPEVLS
jgi:glyoxylate reductase